jgi:hypothetical protein
MTDLGRLDWGEYVDSLMNEIGVADTLHDWYCMEFGNILLARGKLSENQAKFANVKERIDVWWDRPGRTEKCPWLGKSLPSLITDQDKNQLRCDADSDQNAAALMERLCIMTGCAPDTMAP